MPLAAQRRINIAAININNTHVGKSRQKKILTNDIEVIVNSQNCRTANEVTALFIPEIQQIKKTKLEINEIYNKDSCLHQIHVS